MQYWLYEALCRFVQPGHAEINTATHKERKSIVLHIIWENMRNYFPDKYLPIQTLLYVSVKHILINLTSFMGTQNSMRILYNTYFLTES
jgi:hypothetical protein